MNYIQKYFPNDEMFSYRIEVIVKYNVLVNQFYRNVTCCAEIPPSSSAVIVLCSSLHLSPHLIQYKKW